MVFAHREKVVSNLGRFVVIIWCFVVLILTQSYTASLTSMLTVQQLEPTVTDVHDLIQKGVNVAYPKGSFVSAAIKQYNIPESKLKEYDTLDDLDIAFSKGTANGGVAAVFDEIPYMKLFLARHCSKYAMVPILKNAGFGFVFPIGSPLVSDVSRAILNVTEGGQMAEIEKAWFGPDTRCPDTSTLVSSNSLRLSSFWGLFLIVGASSSFAIIIFVFMLLYENRNFLMVKYFKKTKQGENGSDSGSTLSSFPSPSSNGIPGQASVSIDNEDENIILSELSSHNSDMQNSLEMVSAAEIISPNQERGRARATEGEIN